ncbi:ABC-type organic anion transporter ABCA8-like [Xenopus laevis]|uniref:ABC-type organic anion transporter ABCA8-like n=2 Tax=Xenopus laevis TaxID=8355 RepID=A0A8J1LXD0_XENLA|nr:ABC-type organic anion transporter ABCA8-like [Xenopus laevis]
MVEPKLRETSLFQQTLALFWKNLLLKWRRKWHTTLEWLQNLAFLFPMFLLTALDQPAATPSLVHTSPARVLGPLDAFNNFSIGYVHTTSTSRDIMEKVAKSIIIPGIKVQEFADKEELMEAFNNMSMVAVTFVDKFSYQIQNWLHLVKHPNDYFSVMGTCVNSSRACYSTHYWSEGFLSLQASIDSAIIEFTSNHSVWNNMASIVAMKMKSAEHQSFLQFVHVGTIIFIMPLCYVSLMYLLSLYMTRERYEMKEILRVMRLKDLAFWLSWGLLYACYVLIMANLMTLVTKHFIFVTSSYGIIMLLFFLYGIALMSFTFMLSALFRNPRATAIAGFIVTLLLSALGLVVLSKDLPKALEVLLSIFPQFAFAVGLVQSVHMESDLEGIYLSDLMGASSHVLSSFISLALDSVFYMILTLYLEKVLADKHGVKHEPLFFLKKSYWSKEKSSPPMVGTDDRDESSVGDYVEKVPTDMHGKEAIRIHGVKKTYSDDDKNTEALRGLDLNIYEGQITALLGHSGAGKTTLLNILSGMCPTSGGAATVYNYKPSNMSHLEEIKKRVGFCPQVDIKFDPLTVKENLTVFAMIKGIPLNQIADKIRKVLSDLQMNDMENIEANKLSGGQKRKLTFAIAILGDPQILLLDEPTAGLDPCSRHHIWTILKENKADRVTLFSTQFMDEADILADRKAVISKGRLKCVGSSLFLKRKWGIGYHLRMQVSPSCDAELMTSMIKQHIPNAKLTAQNEEEFTYTLPFENMDAFPDLFLHLDSQVGNSIVNYGVSMTTLDDVFLKLEGEGDLESGDYDVFRAESRTTEDREDFSAEMEESLLLMSDSGNVTLSGFALWRQQVLAVARIRLLKLRHDTKSFRSILLLLVLFILPPVIINILASIYSQYEWELTPSLYFQSPGNRLNKYYTDLLICNNTGSSIEDFVGAVKEQNVAVYVTSGKYDMDTVKYRGAIEVSQAEKGYNFTIVGNPKSHNSLPVLLNIISNALLKVLKVSEHIRVWNHPIPLGYMNRFHTSYLTMSFFMIFATGLSPHIAMSSTEDNRINARTQLRVSSLFPSAYWFGQALVDVILYWILLFLMFIYFAFNSFLLLDFVPAMVMITGIIGYGMAMILYVYVICFIFGKGKSHNDSWSLFFVITSYFPAMAMGTWIFPKLYVLLIIFPGSALNGIMEYTQKLQFIPEEEEADATEIILLCIPYLHIIIFFGLLWFLEWRFGLRCLTIDPLFRISRRQMTIKKNPEELSDDVDEDVLAEKERVKKAANVTNVEEKPVIIVDSLRKEYKVKKGGSFFKKNRKAATKNISFCVRKGEVLGLLGPNGAGKTTSMYMLAGEVKPTAGEVVLCGNVPAESPGILGYCPQNNSLWPNLTVKEHLEIYAAVKGMKKEDAGVAIRRIAEALELKEHMEKAARKLSLGVSRKVCFAISMLGNPNIVLLDEPSTGLDPKGQQRLWSAIRAAFKNKDRGAILTTHYMEEAEAVCDRVAIMVSGKIRCIGSIQQLKSKFGKGYLLEIKVKESHQVDQIHKEIIRIFPHAARQDRFSSLLVYKIPKDNVQSLSQVFLLLEEAKRAYNIEEYSFSQSTLEQVFIELAKEQEKEDFGLNNTFQWRHLRTESI